MLIRRFVNPVLQLKQANSIMLTSEREKFLGYTRRKIVEKKKEIHTQWGVKLLLVNIHGRVKVAFFSQILIDTTRA